LKLKDYIWKSGTKNIYDILIDTSKGILLEKDSLFKNPGILMLKDQNEITIPIIDGSMLLNNTLYRKI